MQDPFMFCSEAEVMKADWVLMLYRGGGYVGCYWEWNSCLLSLHQFYFVPLVTSGRNGIRDIATAVPVFMGARTGAEDHVYLIDVKAPVEVWRKVDAEFRCHFLGHTYMLMDQSNANIETTAGLTCDVCGYFFPAADIQDQENGLQFINVECDGGISYSYRNKVCRTCFEEGQCRFCREFDYDNDSYCGIENLENGFCEDHRYLQIVSMLRSINPELLGDYEWIAEEPWAEEEDWYNFDRIDSLHKGRISDLLRRLWCMYEDGEDMGSDRLLDHNLEGQLSFPDMETTA